MMPLFSKLNIGPVQPGLGFLAKTSVLYVATEPPQSRACRPEQANVYSLTL